MLQVKTTTATTTKIFLESKIVNTPFPFGKNILGNPDRLEIALLGLYSFNWLTSVICKQTTSASNNHHGFVAVSLQIADDSFQSCSLFSLRKWQSHLLEFRVANPKLWVANLDNLIRFASHFCEIEIDRCENVMFFSIEMHHTAVQRKRSVVIILFWTALPNF